MENAQFHSLQGDFSLPIFQFISMHQLRFKLKTHYICIIYIYTSIHIFNQSYNMLKA